LVFADPSPLDNPELAFDLPLHEPSDKCPYRIKKVIWRWLGGQTQHCNTSIIGGPEEQRIPKIEIESDNAPVLGRADRYQFRICRPTKTLFWYSSHLVPGLV
jgi:hypothetical protein